MIIIFDTIAQRFWFMWFDLPSKIVLGRLRGVMNFGNISCCIILHFVLYFNPNYGANLR